jgi:predicted RNase H-like nuclease (RuvC/YqgF family)
MTRDELVVAFAEFLDNTGWEAEGIPHSVPFQYMDPHTLQVKTMAVEGTALIDPLQIFADKIKRDPAYYTFKEREERFEEHRNNLHRQWKENVDALDQKYIGIARENGKLKNQNDRLRDLISAIRTPVQSEAEEFFKLADKGGSEPNRECLQVAARAYIDMVIASEDSTDVINFPD